MTERYNDLWNRCFLGPLLSGSYPDGVAAELDPYIRPGDLDSICQPISFLGINHYFRAYIQADANDLLGFRQVSPPARVAEDEYRLGNQSTSVSRSIALAAPRLSVSSDLHYGERSILRRRVIGGWKSAR
jgi:beta-glucosidase/6-phospho-beta-glucosidase/beta-galactosidase